MIDKKRSLLNVGVSIIFRFAILAGSIVVRRLLIQYIGNEINGLNSLYLSIVGFLSVAELGVGSAITFAMYKPIVNQNDDEVAALYQLFRRSYWVIGSVILAIGIIMLPLLPYLAKDYTASGVNLYTTFVLMLVSVVLTYMFSAKVSLINAYKDNYITTAVHSSCMLLQYVLQAVVLIVTASFTWYLISRILSALINWLLIELIANRKHRRIIRYPKQKLSPASQQAVLKNIKALFMHRIGSILVNSADSLVISALIGVAVLGRYSNYTTIVMSMTGVITLIFTPLTSVIGHLFVSDKEEAQKYYNFFFSLNFVVGVVFFLGYYAVVDDLVLLLFGKDLEIARSISLVITVNYFIQFMRQSTVLFRDATGTFYNDRWKPFFEGLLNVVLSVALVVLLGNLFGEDQGVVGVIVATIITNLTICHIVEPYVLYKHAFRTSMKAHLIKSYAYMALFVAVLLLMNGCLVSHGNPWLELLINAVISLIFSAIVSLAVLLWDKDFRRYVLSFVSKLTKITGRKKELR